MFWKASDDRSLKKPGDYHSNNSFEKHFDTNKYNAKHHVSVEL